MPAVAIPAVADSVRPRPWTRSRQAGLTAFNRDGIFTDLDVAFDYFRIESQGDPVSAR
ncbi:hypothetical protein [Qaidamihabitans albus]|uniref:hypothetical protein n=1 Tax=Qaidamihabitans albus TaxID=2795733 RepID=UPI0018F14180|nr:hypothetical protein [Qaidamihabitans albus]